MIRILMIIATLVLLFVSYYLFNKQDIFFVLINKNDKNQGFLQFYGAAYAVLGVMGILTAFSINALLPWSFTDRNYCFCHLQYPICKKIAEPKQ